MKENKPNMQFSKIGAWPVKVVIYISETNEGTILPDICFEIFLFGVLLTRRCIIL